MTEKKLLKIGFIKDERNELVFEDKELRIVARESFGWEFSIMLPNGYAIDFDADRVHVLTKKIKV